MSEEHRSYVHENALDEALRTDLADRLADKLQELHRAKQQLERRNREPFVGSKTAKGIALDHEVQDVLKARRSVRVLIYRLARAAFPRKWGSS